MEQKTTLFSISALNFNKNQITNDMTTYKIDLTAWYLNVERICQLINSPALLDSISVLSGFKGPAGMMSKEGIAISVAQKSLEEWLQINVVPTLGELFAKETLPRQGQLFTIYHDFFGKGLSKYNSPSQEIPRNAVAQIHTKLKYNDEYRLRIFYHPNNLISQTAWSRLGGKSRFFVFAYIEQIENNEIFARPYVIGDLNNQFLAQSPTRWNAMNYGEIHPSEIDQFSLIRDQYNAEKKSPDISILRSIPENSIKRAIAEIVHEGNIPNDWGGEKSDLFTSNVSVDGRMMSTAFLLKGPAKFTPMKMTHLGKNGDQIERLFTEPADLLILQHCHQVTNPVRGTMRAFASRIHDLRYFSILDGYDTIRLMKAYGKCNL
ncbi:MAG: hypothetical protein ABIK15_06070 [Pseudomonadota bacterium]